MKHKRITDKNANKVIVAGGKKGGLLLSCLLLLLVSFGGCNAPKKQVVLPEEKPKDTQVIVTGPNSYDSADGPVLVEKNDELKTLTFLNRTVGKKYTLFYDGTTHFYDKYGQELSLSQIEVGTLVDVTFLKGKKHLTDLRLSSTSWRLEAVESYEFSPTLSEVTIGMETFKLSKDALILAQGQQIDPLELNEADVLSFEGEDRTVTCIRVEKGHGYLRLENDENFIGGWIEVGQSIIQKITEDMLLTVPEGKYPVRISLNESGGTKTVTIVGNTETTLDIGDFEIVAPKIGDVIFSIYPTQAKLYIDGNEMDYSYPVRLEYGLHQVIIKADGYKSITQYIRVGQASAGVDITLDEVDVPGTEDDDSSEDKDSSENSDNPVITDTSVDYYKVHLDAPVGAEVYLDSKYIGIAPCEFKKVPGSHVLTLRKLGYVTKSYTVTIDTDAKDVSYSFPDLEMRILSEPENPTVADRLWDAVLGQ